MCKNSYEKREKEEASHCGNVRKGSILQLKAPLSKLKTIFLNTLPLSSKFSN
jgi:hypothetical protein